MPAASKPAEFVELVCFDLYAAPRAVTAVYRVLLGGLGLTYPQYLVLIVLCRQGTHTVKQLSEALQFGPREVDRTASAIGNQRAADQSAWPRRRTVGERRADA